MTWKSMAYAPCDGSTILVVGGTYSYENRPTEGPFKIGKSPIKVQWLDGAWRGDIKGRVNNPQYWIEPLPPVPDDTN